MKPEITVHKNEQHFCENEFDTWEKRNGSSSRRCSYCGSIHPDYLIYLLTDDKAIAELADQKYGYPHKIYIDSKEGHFKFYIKHLLDIEDVEELSLIVKLIKEKAHTDLSILITRLKDAAKTSI